LDAIDPRHYIACALVQEKPLLCICIYGYLDMYNA
jgi:hypothetical protein